MNVVGVDGCRAGWFAFRVQRPTRRERPRWSSHLFATIDQLWRECRGADLILIDVPIGLLDRGSEPRTCDAAARRRLRNGRAASVFPPPARAALNARDYRDACDRNERATDKRLSKQAFNIMPNIREVDAFLRTEDAARGVIRECHPELCFHAITGRATNHRKSTREGLEERLAALVSVVPEAETMYAHAINSWPRRDVQRDDILDAMVAAWTALGWPDALITLPNHPPRDAAGLPMEMVVRHGRSDQPSQPATSDRRHNGANSPRSARSCTP